MERKGGPAPPNMDNPLDLPNTCFFGSNVESGSATAVVIHTGDRTCFGSLAASIVGFVQLPPLYWLLLGLILQCYVVLTQLVKTWFYRRFGE